MLYSFCISSVRAWHGHGQRGLEFCKVRDEEGQNSRDESSFSLLLLPKEDVYVITIPESCRVATGYPHVGNAIPHVSVVTGTRKILMPSTALIKWLHRYAHLIQIHVACSIRIGPEIFPSAGDRTWQTHPLAIKGRLEWPLLFQYVRGEDTLPGEHGGPTDKTICCWCVKTW